jgi:hypothetical protein
MMQILAIPELGEAIWWNSDGDGFLLVPKKFTEKVIKKYFEGTKFESMIRKLNRWGFKRVTSKKSLVGVLMFRHDLFQYGKPELLKKMRTIVKKQDDKLIRQQLHLDPQLNARQSAMDHQLQGEPAFEPRLQRSGVAHAGSLADTLLGLRTTSSMFFGDHAINPQDVYQAQPIADLPIAHRLLHSLNFSPPNTFSRLSVDRALDNPWQVNRVNRAAVTLEIHRIQQERAAIISAITRNSPSAYFLPSRPLQVMSQVPSTGALPALLAGSGFVSPIMRTDFVKNKL